MNISPRMEKLDDIAWYRRMAKVERDMGHTNTAEEFSRKADELEWELQVHAPKTV